MVCAVCPHCSRQFGHRGKLNRHLLSHTGEKPFPCSLCESRFRSNYALQRHINSHSGAKPYYCPDCERAFTSKEHLVRHFKGRSHQPITCEHCGTAFLRICSYRLHQCTPMPPPLSLDPPICLACNRGFTSAVKLNVHLSSQTHLKQLSRKTADDSAASLETAGSCSSLDK